MICERVNRFLGWRAVARLALRQAPLRRGERKAARGADPVAAARIAETLSDVGDDDLKRGAGAARRGDQATVTAMPRLSRGLGAAAR